MPSFPASLTEPSTNFRTFYGCSPEWDFPGAVLSSMRHSSDQCDFSFWHDGWPTIYGFTSLSRTSMKTYWHREERCCSAGIDFKRRISFTYITSDEWNSKIIDYDLGWRKIYICKNEKYSKDNWLLLIQSTFFFILNHLKRK